MKKHLYLTAALAAAVLSGPSAMAQITYHNGDMLAAFGKAGSTVDVVVDLGSISQFQQAGAATINFAGVSSALTTTFGSTTGLYWAVFGANDTTSAPFDASVTQADPNTIWATMARSNPNVQTVAQAVSGNSGSQNNALGDIQIIGFLAAGSGITLAPNIVSASSDAQWNGFTPQMTSASTSLNGDWSYNMLNVGGAGTADLYQSDPSSSVAAKMNYLGNFTLGSGGNFAFNAAPVPEPTTVALLGGGLVSLLAFRRRK